MIWEISGHQTADCCIQNELANSCISDHPVPYIPFTTYINPNLVPIYKIISRVIYFQKFENVFFVSFFFEHFLIGYRPSSRLIKYTLKFFNFATYHIFYFLPTFVFWTLSTWKSYVPHIDFMRRHNFKVEVCYWSHVCQTFKKKTCTSVCVRF